MVEGVQKRGAVGSFPTHSGILDSFCVSDRTSGLIKVWFYAEQQQCSDPGKTLTQSACCALGCALEIRKFSEMWDSAEEREGGSSWGGALEHSGRRPWVPSAAASLQGPAFSCILLQGFGLLQFLEGLGENISIRKSLFGNDGTQAES